MNGQTAAKRAGVTAASVKALAHVSAVNRADAIPDDAAVQSLNCRQLQVMPLSMCAHNRHSHTVLVRHATSLRHARIESRSAVNLIRGTVSPLDKAQPLAAA